VVLTPVAREILVQVERSAAVGILSTGRDAMVQWRTFIQRSAARSARFWPTRSEQERASSHARPRCSTRIQRIALANRG
jgi:hypothetical protein